MIAPRFLSLAAFASASITVGACAVYDPSLLPRGREGGADATADAVREASADSAMDVVDASGADAMDATAPVDAMDATDAIDAMDVRDAQDAADVREAATEASVDGGCAPGTTNCGGTCVNLASTAAHCGACFNACPTVFNGAPRCQMGACVPLCTAPATAYDEASCVIEASEACPTGSATSWVFPNRTHVRLDSLVRTPTSNVTLGNPCSTSTGADQVFTFTAQVPVSYQAELFSEAFDGTVAIRTAPCTTTPIVESCANASARAARELAVFPSPIASSTPVFVVAKARTTSSGPFALAITPTASCTNRALNGTETCDDGNLASADGCDTACAFTATTGATCMPLGRYEPIRASLGTQRYKVTPTVIADSVTLPCGTVGTRDFVTFVTPAQSGRLEIRGGANESVALLNLGSCADRPIACAGIGVTSGAAVTAGATYALVVESPLRPLEFSISLSQCGNGSIEGSEECDDGNLTAGDGCAAACVREAACELTSAATNTFASASTPPFDRCAVVPFTQRLAILPTTHSHTTRVTLAAGDRVTAVTTRSSGTVSQPWGVEILPEASIGSATSTTGCNTSLAFACSNDAGAANNSVTWISPLGGNYYVRFFSQGVSGATLSSTVTVARNPRL